MDNTETRSALVCSTWPKRFGLRLAGWVILASLITSRAEIPPRPQAGEFFHDLAGIVNDADEQKIRSLQQDTFKRVAVPIVVVTVNRMQDYDPGSPSIESFARRWFDTWQIGTKIKNDGMLVIVSSGDRRARIELGAEWERRFDPFCKRVMDKKMVPEFKSGNYGAGLIAAVESLAAIARSGPKAEPPGPELTERILENPVMKFATENNPIADRHGPMALILMIVAGLGCLGAAIYFPEQRKILVITGIALLALALIFWIVMFALLIFLKARRGFSGGGYGGGGFGGGSSGSGGASGGW